MTNSSSDFSGDIAYGPSPTCLLSPSLAEANPTCFRQFSSFFDVLAFGTQFTHCQGRFGLWGGPLSSFNKTSPHPCGVFPCLSCSIRRAVFLNNSHVSGMALRGWAVQNPWHLEQWMVFPTGACARSYLNKSDVKLECS